MCSAGSVSSSSKDNPDSSAAGVYLSPLLMFSSRPPCYLLTTAVKEKRGVNFALNTNCFSLFSISFDLFQRNSLHTLNMEFTSKAKKVSTVQVLSQQEQPVPFVWPFLLGSMRHKS